MTAGELDGAAERRSSAWRLLLGWYQREGRAGLPWRETRDPYAVLVSEVMLQQTQVERVIPKYLAFLERFPTLEALAAAPVADVIRAWAGLGYNMRAVRLQRVAVQAVRDYGGALPERLEALMALDGVGRYTAGAVACFAFDQQVATVDTNIRRSLWRLFNGVEPAEWPASISRDALALAEWALPVGEAYDWQQALMDLGATVCLARRPACERCPLASVCVAWGEASAATLFPSGAAVTRLRDERAQPAPLAIGERPKTYGAQPRKAKKPAEPFAGGTRYYRGRIVHALRDADAPLTLSELGARVRPGYTGENEEWLRTLVGGLARDGLARVLEAGDDANATRVALP